MTAIQNAIGPAISDAIYSVDSYFGAQTSGILVDLASADLTLRNGTGEATFSGGGNSTIIDCDGVVKAVSSGARYFGLRYESGSYYTTDGSGNTIPFNVSSEYPNGGAAIGDSQTDNTYSFSIQLQRKMAIEVENLGNGGDDLDTIATRFESDVFSDPRDFVIIQGGVNDLYDAVSDPNSSMQASIASMVTIAENNSCTPIFLGVSPWGNYADHTAGRQTYTDTYNAWLESYCSTNSFVFIDLVKLLGDPSDTDNLHADYDSGDGLHWNTAADEVIGEVLYYSLKKNFRKGICIEGEVENLCLYSEDMTNAAWVKSNITVTTPSHTAPDAESTVDLLTSSAANGTKLQTVTASAGDYNYSVWLKRESGQGWIYLTVNNGTTWTRKCVVDTWERFDVTASTTNPVFGIKIETSGDGVYCWGGMLITGKYPKSFIPTVATAVTKPAETLTFPKDGNINEQLGTLVVQFIKSGTYIERDATYNRGVIDSGGVNFRLGFSGSTLYFYKYGTDDNHLISLGNSPILDRLGNNRVGLTWGPIGIGYVYDESNITITTLTGSDGDAETLYNTISDTIYIGSFSSGYQLNGFYQKIWIYETVKTQAEIEAITPEM